MRKEGGNGEEEWCFLRSCVWLRHISLSLCVCVMSLMGSCGGAVTHWHLRYAYLSHSRRITAELSLTSNKNMPLLCVRESTVTWNLHCCPDLLLSALNARTVHRFTGSNQHTTIYVYNTADVKEVWHLFIFKIKVWTLYETLPLLLSVVVKETWPLSTLLKRRYGLHA